MALINNSLSGTLNTDVQPFRITNGDYIDALNITRDSPGEGQDIVVTNVGGNEIVTYALPTGTNKVIGKYPDKIRNRVYYAIWNSYDQDLWLYYDKNTDSIVKIIANLTDTNGVDVLAFDPSFRINHIDIIYNDTDGDLLLYTDGKNTPRKFNINHVLNGNYSVITRPIIEIAKAPPLSPPLCVYGTDTNITSNALRKKLFMFSYRFQYDDFEKTSFSTFSKIPLPIGYYGSDNDIDNTKNNFITLTVETGKQNVIAIEIAMRYSIGDNWSDFVLVTSLNKVQYAIPDDSTYNYLFYNDNIYPPISDGVQYIPDASGNQIQTIPLFDWVPQIAYNQVIANGNTPVYGAIREGYNNYPVSQLNVSLTAANETNSPPDADPPSLTWVNTGSNSFNFTVGGSVPVGTTYRIRVFISGHPPTVITVATYVSVFGDTINTVAGALYAYALAHYSSYAQSYGGGATFTLNFPAGSSILESSAIAGSSGGGGTISTEKTWLWDANYIFGIVYVDEQNRDMPGVTTFTSPNNPNNDFSVTTPQFSLSGSNVQTPVISASINHLPPAGAVKYYWVRRRQTYADFIFYETCDFQSDSDFYYFCLANIDYYKSINSQFIYGSVPITPESRIRIVAGISGGGYDGKLWNQDYEILGTVTRTLTGGTSPDNDKTFIKVKIPASAPSPAYEANMLVFVYTPLANPTNAADSVYWEWGEAYDIYTLNGVNYHRGKDQDQTATQSATFTWPEGDVYFHERTMYDNLVTPFTDTVPIMDANWSDFFDSAVNDNGRAQVIEVNAQQLYNPVLIRNGGAYQAGTTVNQINKFLFEDFQEADRGWGDIRKLYIRNRYMYVMQKFKIGVVPILLQIVRDTAGNPLEANSDILLNKINYPYNEDIGIGDIPESFASDKDAMYGADDYRAVVWRLSQDGIIVISVLYECNSFFSIRLPSYRKSLNNGNPPNGGVYTGDATVHGVFDAFTNKYIIALEEINRYNSQGYPIFHQDGASLSFNEVSGAQGGVDAKETMEGFESFLSYRPDMMVTLDVLLITFKDGALWKHTLEATHCNFYGVQNDAYITLVFNENALEKKTWQAITELSDTLWECPEISTNVTSYGNKKQTSKLIPQNFSRLENDWHSAILRDQNSNGGLYNGATMKGNYMIVKLLKQNASELVYLNGVSVKYADSPLTNR